MNGSPPPGSPVDAARYVTESLPALLRLLQSSDVRELEVQEGEVHIRLRRAASDGRGRREDASLIVDSAPALPAGTPITAPLVGTFYRAGKVGMEPLVRAGSHVVDDTVVGIIEALHVLTEVEAGCQGQITRVLASDGEPVQYGQVLFEVDGE